jgi:hypothetical protein
MLALALDGLRYRKDAIDRHDSEHSRAISMQCDTAPPFLARPPLPAKARSSPTHERPRMAWRPRRRPFTTPPPTEGR